MSAVHDIWENDVSDLQARVKFKAYPPRITAAVSGDAAFDNVTETVSFEGARGGDLSRGVNLMLPTDHVGTGHVMVMYPCTYGLVYYKYYMPVVSVTHL